jgi:sporulation protein YlmC with PRC-barrel domain
MGSAYPIHDLITASRVTGTPAFNTAGERIGHVDDLSIDKVTGQVTYALLSFGGFLGFGEKFQPLPWSLLTYDRAKGGYVVPVARADLEAAPAFTADELEHFGGRHQEVIDRYYGAMPPI